MPVRVRAMPITARINSDKDNERCNEMGEVRVGWRAVENDARGKWPLSMSCRMSETRERGEVGQVDGQNVSRTPSCIRVKGNS